MSDYARRRPTPMLLKARARWRHTLLMPMPALPAKMRHVDSEWLRSQQDAPRRRRQRGDAAARRRYHTLARARWFAIDRRAVDSEEGRRVTAYGARHVTLWCCTHEMPVYYLYHNCYISLHFLFISLVISFSYIFQNISLLLYLYHHHWAYHTFLSDCIVFSLASNTFHFSSYYTFHRHCI